MKRLRENTMLEAEISPAGEVLVEGHHVGELQGFRFTVDQGAEGEDAKAVRAAAQKALAREFEARADRFANAPNGDLALGSDGILRWIGAPVATLVAGEDMLKPRLVLLADEQLTGTPRDRVAARAERYVAFQVETLLKPLGDLSTAEILSGIAKGIAFRLVENSGLVNRRDIAEEVRSLDQDARAALRRLGVRFGAYHVFVPALLKPAPAGLLTLLWALKNDAKDKPGFGDVVHMLGSGRTSLVVDPAFEKAFYKLAGYRNLGRRAVRVDILERLADLIRPALAWKENEGKRPEGGYGGGAFVVTPAMMSILGATAEDMEEILKGLGYRGEPKPAAEVAARIETLDAAQRAAEANAEPVAGEAVLPNAVDADADQPVAGPDLTVEPAAPDEANLSHHDVMADPNVSPAPAAEALSEEPAEEPKPVIVWRQGRFDRGGRPGERNQRPGGGQRPGDRRGRPGGQQEAGEREGGGRPPRRFDRHGKPDGKPGGREERGEGGGEQRGFKGKRPPREGGGKDRPFQQRPREERAPRIDPDSPFAKLAALRDQLKK
jgi:ATP-dependent RNA helicase SUPV3L1/SUV3